VVGKAVMENIPIPASFTRFIFKTLQVIIIIYFFICLFIYFIVFVFIKGEEAHVSDIVSVDPELAAQVFFVIEFYFLFIIILVITNRRRIGRGNIR
jgi:hypothetical protein